MRLIVPRFLRYVIAQLVIGVIPAARWADVAATVPVSINGSYEGHTSSFGFVSHLVIEHRRHLICMK
jgi:hypothetical protein